jgi:hypothetical protein
MEDAFGRLPAGRLGDWERGWTPAVDMVDHDDEIVLRPICRGSTRRTSKSGSTTMC